MANGIYFIKTETDLTGGTNYTITGTSQLLSVAYALHAKTAESISGILDETDPVYGESVASGITGADTTNWNNKLGAEIDGDVTNELQMFSVSGTGDTLYISEGNWVIIPGISQAQLPLTDYDGNVYQTIVLGNQKWMVENLRTIHYSDGIPIPKVTGLIEWMNLALTDKAYCWFNNDSITNAITYGALYSWAASMNGSASSNDNPSGIQGVCPIGWHMPSNAEWTELIEYLTISGYGFEGSGNDIAKSMASTSNWTTFDTTGTIGNDQASNNSSGFTAFPGGYRDLYGNFAGTYLGAYAGFWTATENDGSDAWHSFLYYNDSVVYQYTAERNFGFSIRCVED